MERFIRKNNNFLSLIYLNDRVKYIVQFINDLINYKTPVKLNDSPITTWDLLDSYNAYVTFSTNRTLSINNLTFGDYGTLDIKYPIGGCIITLPAGSLVSNSGAGILTLPASANPVAVASFYFNQDGILKWNLSTNFT